MRGISDALEDGGEDPGVLVSNGADMKVAAAQFIEAVGAHRPWERGSDPRAFDLQSSEEKHMAHADSEPTIALRVTHTMTIQRSPRDVYKAWRDLESVTAFMENVISVTEEGTRSRNIVKAAADAVEWDAYLVADVPGELIAWRSTPGADVANSGEVRFQRTARGRATEMRVALNWESLGRSSGAVTELTGGDPKRQLVTHLMRFKQLLETGGLATTQGQPRGSAQEKQLEDERDDVLQGRVVPHTRTESVLP